MKLLTRFILISILLPGQLVALAQPTSILFEHFTNADGLSNNDVKKVYKDKKGFIWIGTEYGLNRFDGKTFKIYRHNEKDSNSLPSNTIVDLLEDQLGYIWIATAAGLCRFNPMTNQFLLIPFPKNPTAIIEDYSVGSITQNPFDQSIWIGSGKGLYRVNGKKGILEPAIDRDSANQLTGLPVGKIVFTAPNECWLTTQKGLFVYHPSSGLYQRFSNPVEKSHAAEPFLPTALYWNNKNLLWVGTWGAGLHCFNISTKTWEGYYLPEPNSGIQGGANVILDITKTDLPGQDSILWIASETSSLQAFNCNSKTFTSYQAQHRDDRRGVFESARSLFYTSSEGLWIASTFGLYRYDPNRQLFREYAFRYPFKTGCLSNPVVAYADPVDNTGNTIWLSTISCGLYLFDVTTTTVKPIPAWLQQQLADNKIQCVFRDKDNRLWMGTAANGLLLIDEKQKKIIALQNVSTVLPQLKAKRISQLAEDNKGNLWIGADSGFYVLNAERKAITPIQWNISNDIAATLSTRAIGICFDKQDNAWISLCNDGTKLPVIGKVAAGNYTAIPFYHQSNNNNSLPERMYIRRLVCDDNNTIWCASRNGLINWSANSATPHFTRLTDQDGLISSSVYKVVIDESGRIWATTVGGLSVYNPKEKKFRNFHNALYGLDKENTSQIFYSPFAKEILLGYTGKLYGLPTQKITQELLPPAVAITDFKVDNKTFYIFGKAAGNGAHAVLGPDQNMVSIDFSALSYTNSFQNSYAYRLEGVDKDWVYTSSNSASYKLPEGKYVFHVKAANADGIWSTKEAIMRIEIKPPYYKSWWFILACITAAVLLIYIIFRVRIQRLKAIYQVRNFIARDLHDEIGSTLTSINILSQVSQNNLHKDQRKTSTLLEKITEQSLQIQQDMSDIVWTIRPDNDKIENMVVRMREYLSHTLEPKNIAIDFDADERVMKESLTMQQRKEFFLIFKEAINNTAKHADCRQVFVQLCKKNRVIQLLIKDNGIGFNVAHQTSSSGIKNMIQRSILLKGFIDIQSTPEQGTQILLQVPAN